MKSKLITVILSGGTGTRLWPVSRESFPKPFASLVGDNSLLEQTLARAAAIGSNEIAVVCNREHQFLVQNVLADVSVPCRLFLEPEPRNTAAAMAVACIEATAQDGADTVLLAMPADHRVNDVDAFRRTCGEAVRLAEQGYIMTLGIEPTRPETGYGYLESGDALAGGGFKVARFIEKPDLEVAMRLATSGRHFWNSGIFCFKAGVLLQALDQHAPDILAQARLATAKAERSPNGDRWPTVQYRADEFSGIRSESIDYAVMEKAGNLGMVPAAFDWNDVGSWPSVFAEAKVRDVDGNAVRGDVALVNSRNVSARAESRLVAAVGVENLIIVETADAVLVLNPEHAQSVKTLAEGLKREGHACHDTHLTVYRPWGTYTVLEEGPGFKIKRIVVNPGKSLSLQLHHHRSEHWVVVSGVAVVQIGDEEFTTYPNESRFIPIGQKHRLTNRTGDDLVMIEVQCGQYLGEDDIVRFADHYGRQ